MIVSECMCLSQNQTPSYKTINRFKVNPKVDALLASLVLCINALNIRKVVAPRDNYNQNNIKKAISILFNRNCLFHLSKNFMFQAHFILI